MQIADLFYSIRSEGFDQLESKINNTSKKFSDVGKNLINNVTKPIMGIASEIVNTTMTFDQEMSKVKAVTGSTGKDFDTLRDLALDMGSSTSKSATEAAEAISYMGLAGWDLTQIQEGLEPILRASEAGMMDLGTTSDLVTDSMSALGIGTKDLGRYLDIAAQAQNSSNQSMQQFLEAMVAAGGTFKMFNVPLEESGALLGILANRGFKGAEAGNALTSIMANLTSGSGQAGEAMKSLGVEVYDSNGKFRGTTTILKELNDKFDGMTEAQRNTYIQMIGGKTRTKEFTALLNGTSEELDNLTDGLYNSDGALSDMAQTMKDNFGGQVTSIKSKLEGIAISIGDRLTPYLKIAAEWLQKLTDWFYKLPGPIKDVIIVVTLIVASIGPLLLVFAGLISAIGFVGSAFTTIAGIISAIGVPIAIAVTVLTGLGIAIAGLLLSSENVRNSLKEKFKDIVDNVKNAAIWIKQHIDDIKNAFIGLFQGLTTGDFSTFKEAMKNMVPPETMEKITSIIEKIKVFREKIIEVRDKIIEFAQNVNEHFQPLKQMFIDAFSSFDISAIINSFNQLKETLGPVIDILKMVGIVMGTILAVYIGIAIGAWNGFISALDNVIALILNLVGIVTSVFGLIVGIITGDGQLIQDSIKNLWENIKGFFVNGVTAIIDVIVGFVEGIITWFTSLYNTLVGNSIIPDLINSIITWFTSLPGKILNVIVSFVNKVINYFNNLKTRAVTVFNALKTLVIAVWNNIKSQVASIVSNFVSNILSKINSFKNNMSNIWNNIKSKASSIWNSIKSTVVSIISNLVSSATSKLNNIKSNVSNILNTVKSKFSSVWNSIKSTVINTVSSMVSRVKTLLNGLLSPIKTIGNKISGLISSAKNVKIPGFASGVQNFIGGWAMVGEQGPELMYVPKGSDIYSNQQSKNLLNNTKPTKLITTTSNNQDHINLYGNIVIDAKSVKEFNDIVDVLKNVQHYKNTK